MWDALDAWWLDHSPSIRDLPATRDTLRVRTESLESFAKYVGQPGLLDEYEVQGVIVSWWEAIKYDLRTLATHGFEGLVESWATTLETLADDSSSDTDLADEPLVLRAIPSLVEELGGLEAIVARLEDEKTVFELVEDRDTPNPMKELEDEHRDEKRLIREDVKRIRFLSRGSRVKDGGSIAAVEARGEEATALRLELEELTGRVAPIEKRIDELQGDLMLYKGVKSKLAAQRKEVKAARSNLLGEFRTYLTNLTDEETQSFALDEFRRRLDAELDRRIAMHRRTVLAALETWWDKYQVTLGELVAERGTSEASLREMLTDLGYS